MPFKIGRYIGKTVDRILKASLQHHSGQLPVRSGWLMRWLLAPLLNRIPVDPKKLISVKKLPTDAIIVYVTSDKRNFEWLFNHLTAAKMGLPRPLMAFDHRVWIWQPVARLLQMALAGSLHWIRFGKKFNPYGADQLKSILNQHGAAQMALIGKRDFRQRFVKQKADPLVTLLAMQQQSKRPIFLVPQLFFHSRRPDPVIPSLGDIVFGTEQKPHKIRILFTLIRNPKQVFFEFSQPVDLRAEIHAAGSSASDLPAAADSLRRRLIERINAHRQSVTGPQLKSDAELKQQILTSPRLQRFMRRYARRRKSDMQSIHAQGLSLLNEIASRISPSFLRLAIWTAKWLVGSMFDGVSVNEENLEPIRKAARNGPVIFVPCHKSHVDSLLVSYLLYCHQLPCPLIFAGKNMGFWPVGPLFRRFGAFFVRRSFRGAVFYATILSEYIHQILKDGYNILVFIEGTRSRSGKLLPPQSGMLTILLNALRNRACRDLHFVPVYIGYDRVPEEAAYLHETAGGQKKPESFWQMLAARKVVKVRHGWVNVRFGAPLALTCEMQSAQIALDNGRTRNPQQLAKNIAERMVTAIGSMTVVTPRVVVAAALLASSRRNFTREVLAFRVDTLVSHLKLRQAPMAQAIGGGAAAFLDEVLDYFKRRKIIIAANAGKRTDDPGPFHLPPDRRVALEFYKNNTLHHFVDAALVALAVRRQEAFQFSSVSLFDDYAFLLDLFGMEFPPNPELPPAARLRKTIKCFITDAILFPHPSLPDTYQVTAAGHRKLNLFGSLVHPLLDAYWMVLWHCQQNMPSTQQRAPDLKKIRREAHRLYHKKVLLRKEALSMNYFANATDHLTRNGPLSGEEPETIRRHAAAVDRYRALLPE